MAAHYLSSTGGEIDPEYVDVITRMKRKIEARRPQIVKPIRSRIKTPSESLVFTKLLVDNSQARSQTSVEEVIRDMSMPLVLQQNGRVSKPKKGTMN